MLKESAAHFKSTEEIKCPYLRDKESSKAEAKPFDYEKVC